MRLAIAALAFALLPAASPATELLESALAEASQAAEQSKPDREYYLESYGGGWRLRPDPNPPGSELTIRAEVGQRVRLRLVLLPGRGFPEASFVVRGLEAVVDGEPVKSIDLWFRSAPSEAVVDFTPAKEGLFLIEESYRSPRTGRAGLIIVSKPKPKR